MEIFIVRVTLEHKSTYDYETPNFRNGFVGHSSRSRYSAHDVIMNIQLPTGSDARTGSD